MRSLTQKLAAIQLVLLSAVAVLGNERGAPSKPNILFVLADQWRAAAFGYAGDPNVKTPHLDRLAGQGVNFANAVAGMPVCCPTRASLLTGQRPLTHGVFLNDVELKPETVTIAEVLRSPRSSHSQIRSGRMPAATGAIPSKRASQSCANAATISISRSTIAVTSAARSPIR